MSFNSKSDKKSGASRAARRVKAEVAGAMSGPAPEYRKSILPNGIRVLTERHPVSRAVSCGVWVTRGTRDEFPHEAGIAHFVEHLVFKRTAKRTAYQISRDMEAVGGELNAYTSREYTSFVSHTLKEHVGLSLDVLSDLVCRPSFHAADIKKEKQVVIQEIQMAEEQLEDIIFDEYFKLVFPDSPLGKPILGTRKSIEGMKRETIVDYHRRQFVPENMLVSVAGNIDHDEVLGLVHKHLKFSGKDTAAKTSRHHSLARGKSARDVPGKTGSAAKGKSGWAEAGGSTSALLGRAVAGSRANENSPARISPEIWSFREVIQRPAEQVHILVGLPAASFRDRLRFDGYIVNTLLGGGMTSRLYQSVREEKGLVYSIFSALNSFIDTGLMTIYAGTEPVKAPEVVEIILKEIKRLKKSGVKKADVEFFKTQVLGQILLGADDIENRMNSLGVNEMVFGRYRSVDDVMRDIRAVNLDSVHEYIETYLDLDQMGILLMGATPEGPTRKWLEQLG